MLRVEDFKLSETTTSSRTVLPGHPDVNHPRLYLTVSDLIQSSNGIYLLTT